MLVRSQPLGTVSVTYLVPNWLLLRSNTVLRGLVTPVSSEKFDTPLPEPVKLKLAVPPGELLAIVRLACLTSVNEHDRSSPAPRVAWTVVSPAAKPGPAPWSTLAAWPLALEELPVPEQVMLVRSQPLGTVSVTYLVPNWLLLRSNTVL